MCGSLGHQRAAFRGRFPKIKGRVALQDRAQPVELVKPMEGIGGHGAGFFHAAAGQRCIFPRITYQEYCRPRWKRGARSLTPYPRDAKSYYLRFHPPRLPRRQNATPFSNPIPAMDRAPLILIDEMLLPSPGLQWPAAQLDPAMMAALGSRVRTREQWGGLREGVRVEG